MKNLTFTTIQELINKTLLSIENVNDRELILKTAEGETYRFYHEQDCCEDVFIEDIEGNLEDLQGAPLLVAEEASSSDVEGSECYDSCTWTFYRFRTVKGSVTIRWVGESNGYYSESVDFEKVN